MLYVCHWQALAGCRPPPLVYMTFWPRDLGSVSPKESLSATNHFSNLVCTFDTDEDGERDMITTDAM